MQSVLSIRMWYIFIFNLFKLAYRLKWNNIYYAYFESLRYTLISQIPKEKGFDFLSNIGGILGLFVGVSFVTLFEISELIIEFLFIVSEYQKSNRIIQVTFIQTDDVNK
jgi:hypothetical protein